MNTIFETRRKRVSKYQQPIDFNKIDVPDELYHKCPECEKMHHVQEVISNLIVCPSCGFHIPLPTEQRIKQIADAESFIQFKYDVKEVNPLDFPGYHDKITKLQDKLKIDEAVMGGTAEIVGNECVLVIMDNAFFMGSMGSIVGERITSAIEYATNQELPLVIFSTSGGARMQEGLFSLMQMAKTSAALAKHHDANLLYISVLTNPTTGGVSASYAMLGDIILSEPGALICFAGPRVIKDTIKQELPNDFQSAEFLQKHGFIDIIVERAAMRETLGKLLTFHSNRKQEVITDGE